MLRLWRCSYSNNVSHLQYLKLKGKHGSFRNSPWYLGQKHALPKLRCSLPEALHEHTCVSSITYHRLHCVTGWVEWKGIGIHAWDTAGACWAWRCCCQTRGDTRGDARCQWAANRKNSQYILKEEALDNSFWKHAIEKSSEQTSNYIKSKSGLNIGKVCSH